MSQTKITLEADAGRLLRRTIAAGYCELPSGKRSANACMWLERREFVRLSFLFPQPRIYITEPRTDQDGNRVPGPMTGREYYEGLCANPAVTVSVAAWTEEARSGQKIIPGPLGSVTVRSPISRACIPGPSPPRTPRSPEDMVADMERDMAAQIRWCERLGVSPDELRELGQEGRIRFCAGCESVGVFDRDRGGWKSKCRTCRKDGRK